IVSGFFTSPCDHWRIFSGDASEMRIALNERGSLGFSKKLKMSFTFAPIKSRCSMGTPLKWCPRHLGRSGLLGGNCFDACGGSVFHQLHVEAQRLQLLDEHVEALRQAGL